MRTNEQLLAEGTQDGDIAINWHRHIVPTIDKELAELRAIMDQYPNDAIIAETFGPVIAEKSTLLEAFLKQWPRPKREILNDVMLPEDGYQALYQQATFVESLPSEPLTYLNDPAKCGQALCRNAAGELLKAPSIWYNMPGQREKTTWAW